MTLTTYLVYAIIAITSVLTYFIKNRLNYWKKLGIPHDEPHFLMGNIQGLMKTRSFADIFGGTYRKYKGTGPFCGFFMQHRPMAVILDINLVKNILIKDFTNFTDRGLFHNEIDDPLTGHLFLLDGLRWKTMRSKLSPTFTSGKMRFMYPTIIKVADEFVQVFGEMIDNSGNEIEIKELLARFTTDVIGSCAFGVDCNSLKDPNAEFRLMGKSVFTERRHGNIVQLFIQSFPHLARKLHLKFNTDKVSDFFLGIVKETVEYRRKNNIKRNDFLNILMELSESKEITDEQGNLKGLTLEEMAAQVFVFFLGGFETSSSTMGFALYELAKHPKEQHKLRQEIMDTYKKGDSTYESIKSMQYLKMVMYETLRKYPIVPHLNRQALNDYVIPNNPKYTLEKGTPIIIPVMGIHHDPEFYPRPEVWDPERFSADKIQQRDSVEWLPFGDGPRNCIGARFGEMQTRVGLAYLLKNFKFSMCAQSENPLVMDKTAFTVSPLNGIMLKVERL